MATTLHYTVTGMTCAHCSTAVADEVGQLPGVTEVDVDLHPGGESRVTVTSDRPLEEGMVRAALDEAGDYSLLRVSV